MLNGKKIAILIAPQVHDEEADESRNFLVGRNADVEYIGLDAETVSGKYGRLTFKPDRTINDVDVDEFEGLLIPGGGAPERIRINEKAVQFVRDFWNTGRPVAAICHGAQVLISAGVLPGITLTCYAGIRDDVENAGAVFVDQEVVVDGQLVSSRRPDDLPAFHKAFADALCGKLLPVDEMSLSPRDALNLAVSREKGAQQFYAAMSDVVKDEAVKNKFTYLSAVEEGHFEQLADLFKQITGGEEPIVDLDRNELGKHRVAPETTAEEAVKLAISAEEKAYEFYRFAANKSKGQKIKDMFEYLAAEELEHKRLLLLDTAVAQGGQGHFQWATHFDIPPGMDDLW